MVRRALLSLLVVSLACAGVLGAIPAAAGSTLTATTTTTVTTKATSSQYDTYVLFTAHVRALHGTPTGSVTFSDASNGSVLETTMLSAGTAKLRTAALAPGAREIVASYAGSDTFAPSTSAPLTVTVTAAGADSTAYQVDAQHDGNQQQGSLAVATLRKRWQLTLGGTGGSLAEGGDVSYPVIAGGRVFVTVENTQSYGGVLYAINETSGATDWSVGIAGTYGFSALTYDGRQLFALNFNGVLTDFDAGTGTQAWSMQLPGQYSFTAPPTAYDGVVYVSGSGSGGTVYAVSEADTTVRWTAPVEYGDKSSPAVDDTGAYVSYACQQDYRFTLGGAQVWHHTGSCSGGGGSTAVLHGARLYARGFTPIDTPVVLATSDGTQQATFASRTAPGFDASNMYTVSSGKLVAVAPSGSPDRWTFGDGTLVTAPVVYGSTVFVGSSSGTVYGVSASTGAQVWSGSAGATIVGPDEQDADVLIGMAAGANRLIVPAANVLTAFG